MGPGDGAAVFDKDRLAAGGAGEFAELGAGELKEGGGLRAAPALEQGERGQKLRWRRRGGVELHPEGDGVARGRGGKIGREVEAKHVAQRDVSGNKPAPTQLRKPA